MDIKINEYPLLEVIVDNTVLHNPVKMVIPFLKFSGCLRTVIFVFPKEQFY